MINSEKNSHYKDVLTQLEDCHKNILSIINANNPFSDLLREYPKEIYEIIMFYIKFDKLRNGVKNSDKIQKDFERYLNNTEQLINQIRSSAISLAETGLKFDSIEESKGIEFVRMIKEDANLSNF
jgi:hypothetical protein